MESSQRDSVHKSASSVRSSVDFNGPLNALAISPNNKLVAVGGRDGTNIKSLHILFLMRLYGSIANYGAGSHGL